MNRSGLEAAWFAPLSGLVRAGEFAEACQLASYFPPGLGRTAIECASAVGTKHLDRAESLLRTIDELPHRIGETLAFLLPDMSTEGWLATSAQAHDQNQLVLGHACLEAGSSASPMGAEAIGPRLRQLIDAAIHNEDAAALGPMLSRAIDHISDIDSLRDCAKSAMLFHLRSNDPNLLGRIRGLAGAALEKMPADDVAGRIKVAAILTMDEETLKDAFEILRGCIDTSPQCKARASELLLALLSYKPYVDTLSSYLLAIDNTNIMRITDTLVRRYAETQDRRCRQWLNNALSTSHSAASSIPYEFISSLVCSVSIIDDLEKHACAVLALDLDAADALSVAKALVARETPDLQLVAQLAEKADASGAEALKKAKLEIYGRLSVLASKRSDIEFAGVCFSRALAVASSSQSLFDAIGDSLLTQMRLIIDNGRILKERKYLEDYLDRVITSANLKTLSAAERRQILEKVLATYDVCSHVFLRAAKVLFSTDLELSETQVGALQSLIDNIAETGDRAALTRELRKQVPEEPAWLKKAIAKLDGKVSKCIELKARGVRPPNVDDNEAQLKRLLREINAIKEEVENTNEIEDVSKAILGRRVEAFRAHVVRVFSPDKPKSMYVNGFSDFPVYDHGYLADAGTLTGAFIREYSECLAKAEPRPESHAVRMIERHTRISFPERCSVGAPAHLRVQLTEDVPLMTRALERISLKCGRDVEAVELDIQVSGTAFAIHKDKARIKVPWQGDSEEALFWLFPVVSGEQTVEVEFYQGSKRVGYVIVTTEVSNRDEAGAATRLFSMEDPVHGLGEAQDVELEQIERERRTIHITWNEKESKLSYTVYSDNPYEFGEWEIANPGLNGGIEDGLRHLNAAVAEIVSRGNVDDDLWASLCLNLEGIGRTLYERLVPEKLADVMSGWAEGSTLIISTNEQWVPWELVHDGRSFWGDWFMLARLPRLSDRTHLPSDHRPIRPIARAFSHIVNVVGGGIGPTETVRAKGLFGLFPSLADVQCLECKPLAALVRALGGAQVLHLTCHGYLDPHMLQVANGRSCGENLLIDSVRQLKIQPGCFVFANACASTVPALTFGKFNSFGWEFYRRGADAFVGTLGAIPTTYALPFAERLYAALLSQNNSSTLGRALATAKREAAKERNLFWLLYTLFGDPDIRYSIER